MTDEGPTSGSPDDPQQQTGSGASPAPAPRRRGSRAALVASATAVVVGVGLVTTALVGQADQPVEPARTDVGAAAAPYTSSSTPSSSTPTADVPGPQGTAPSASGTDGGAPTSSPTRPAGSRKSDVLPQSITAPSGAIPGVVRMGEDAATEPTPEPTEEAAPEVAEPVRLRIPAIDVESDLLHLGLNEDGTLEVPPRTGEDNLKAAWYDGSPRAGEIGPTVISGHIDSKAGPSVFYHLGELAKGDEVLVDRADGSTATFVVDGLERYPKDDFPTVRVYGNTTDPQIRLITCGGDFDRDSGHYEDNTVVYGHLVDG
ncbi:class F sortase [Pseudokineococcus basanitobsidens]|uniref:Class F sortase n=1 Tax=Pseudokineococcus basanitobsidens TaxID=1926649 RepID=A0ABU8RNG5_9ACTN